MTWAERWFGALLRLLPARFRARHGEAMRETFARAYAEHRAGGRLKLAAFLARTTLDLMVSGVRARLSRDRGRRAPERRHATAGRGGLVSWVDVRLGLRLLGKQPGLTLVATFALAVGIPVGLAPAHFVDGIILLDEWQHVPAVWDAVRRRVDDDATANQFLFTGSAGPSAPPTHSGAGRIVRLRMRPLSLAERSVGRPTVSLSELLRGGRPPVSGETEVGLAEYVREIVASGLPGLRHLTGRALRAQLDGYVKRVVDRDFEEPAEFSLRQPETLVRWLTAYAAATSTTASFETIRDASTSDRGDKPAKTTVIPYREVLERLWVLDPVEAWLPTRNRLRRLSQPPKHHLADPALAARLLGVDADALLAGEEPGPPIPRDGPLLGHLFESLVTLGVRVFAQAAEARVRHLRQYGGQREIDLIVERPDQRVVAIEVKLTATVGARDVKHLLWLREQLGEDLLDAVVVHTGPAAYRREDGIAVVPAALLGA